MTTTTLPDWIRAAHPDATTGVALKGNLSDGSGTPWLVADPAGPLLVARREDQVLTMTLAQADVRHQARLLGDQLHVDGATLTVPLGQAEAVRALVARARLQAWSGGQPARPTVLPVGPWIVQPAPVVETWMSYRIAEDEAVIAWLPTTTRATLVDDWEPDGHTSWCWCLTDKRNLLVALSPLGAALEVELTPGTVLVDGGGGCHAGDRRWQVERKRLALARFLAPLCGLPPEHRTGEAARKLAAIDSDGARAHAALLLDHVAPLDRPLGSLQRAVVARTGPPLPSDLLADLRTLPDRPDCHPEDLVSWFESWTVPAPLARAVLATLRDIDPVFALPLHEVIHERAALELRGGRVDRAGDLELARHHLQADQADGIEALLAGHVAAMGPGGLDQVLADPEVHLADVPPPPLAEELGLLDALAMARHRRGTDDPGLLGDLARRQPLQRARLAALAAAVADGDLAERTRHAQRMLDDGLPATRAVPGGKVVPLSAAQLAEARHPVTHQGGALARLSRALAKIEPPDAGALRDYCERLDAQRHAAASTAVADAAVLLGLPAVPTFVSRGQRNIGLRAHERPEPFLVIGGAHLDSEGPDAMSEPELAFAVGAELAHLRWQHSRISSDDVWAGVWDKGAIALSATAALLPLLEVLRMPGRLARLGVAGAGAFSTLRDAGSRLGTDKPAPPEASDMSVDQARLLAVHRAMQLSADRIGLVLCGDPVAAVRAMMLQHSRLRGELTIAGRQGLATTLLRRDEHGALVLPHLALRVASLLAFWMSTGYADLRLAARPPQDSVAGGVTS